CGKEILYKKPHESDELCVICLWRNDPKQFNDPDNEDGFNGISLETARKNYKKYRYCDVKFLRNAKYNA
ncbi:MAG TPA: CPCC family cysteine-rich protein, partial [Clostridia bacterium]|nr:CPCC family cysteine-rich protein [Clostridia bacterium]